MRRGWKTVLASAEKIGLRFEGRQQDAALARATLYWCTIAYKRGEAAAARSLALEFWRLDPVFSFTNRNSLICTADCLTTLLPKPLNHALQGAYTRYRLKNG